jgi:hypothetical protein
MLRTYVSGVLNVSEVCCKCFISVLQKVDRMLHMLQWLYSMFQVYVPNVSANVCCKYFYLDVVKVDPDVA